MPLLPACAVSSCPRQPRTLNNPPLPPPPLPAPIRSLLVSSLLLPPRPPRLIWEWVVVGGGTGWRASLWIVRLGLGLRENAHVQKW